MKEHKTPLRKTDCTHLTRVQIDNRLLGEAAVTEAAERAITAARADAASMLVPPTPNQYRDRLLECYKHETR